MFKASKKKPAKTNANPKTDSDNKNCMIPTTTFLSNNVQHVQIQHLFEARHKNSIDHVEHLESRRGAENCVAQMQWESRESKGNP